MTKALGQGITLEIQINQLYYSGKLRMNQT